MKLLTVDFETYYSKDVGFRTQTTEEYIHDPQFEVIGVSVKVDHENTVWFSGTREATRKFLSQYDWKNYTLLCHNTMFDGAILNWCFNITPRFYLDTLCMARAIHGTDAGGSLAALAEKYSLGVKGTEVVNAIGKYRVDFTADELKAYGEYCKNDTDLTYQLFKVLEKDFPDSELLLIDLTLRMFVTTVLELEEGLLLERLEVLRDDRHTMLGSLVSQLGYTGIEHPEEAVRKKLASNKQFAAVLETFGIEPPMKISKTTGKSTFALAKNDPEFLNLLENPDPFIQQLCAVRLGTKSTIEESRILRFIDIGRRNRGKLPIPLKYYGAHTGRWAGADKVNFQNLPSRDKNKKALKNAVVAPEGYVVINCDSSQIEARVLAWLASEHTLVKKFAKGEDVYSSFAEKVYEYPVSKATPIERFVGKTCILGLGYGTGALKLQNTLKTTPPGAVLALDKCTDIVDLYRSEHTKITDLWAELGRVLNNLIAWPKGRKPYWVGEKDALKVSSEGIQLPNGLYIRYPNIRLENQETIYDSRKGPVKLWGGAAAENVVQALARVVVGEQMLKIAVNHRLVLTVHDSAVVIVPEDDVEDAVKDITNIMSTSPMWAPDLPVACEAKFGHSYGDC